MCRAEIDGKMEVGLWVDRLGKSFEWLKVKG